MNTMEIRQLVNRERAEASGQLSQQRMKYVMYSILVGGADDGISRGQPCRRWHHPAVPEPSPDPRQARIVRIVTLLRRVEPVRPSLRCSIPRPTR
jgi:hypothetical protein